MVGAQAGREDFFLFPKKKTHPPPCSPGISPATVWRAPGDRGAGGELGGGDERGHCAVV